MVGIIDICNMTSFATNWQQTQGHISLYLNVLLIDLSVKNVVNNSTDHYQS